MKIISVLIVVVMQVIFISPQRVLAATAVGLGTADSFAVLAGSGITNTGTTTITGDVGSHPTTTQTGFGSVTITGTNHAGDATTQGAKTDLVTAYNDAAGQGPTTPIVGDLGGQTFTAGIYNSGSTIGLTGTVTLNGEGNPNAIFIFQAGSALTTASSSVVTLTNSAQACNVFWQIGSDATLGTGSTFRGTLIALSSITVTTSATVDGRVLARNGAVTLDTNTITKPTCVAPTATPTPTSTPTPTPTSTPTPTPTPTSTSTSTSTTTSSSSSSSSSVGGASTCVSLGITTIPSILEARRVSPTSIFVRWGPNAGLSDFMVQYGYENGKWIFNNKVSGFSTTINDLPANQSIWIQVAATDNCAVGTYGAPVLVGGTASTNYPGFPNTGFDPNEKNIPLIIIETLVLVSFVIFYLIRKTNAKKEFIVVLLCLFLFGINTMSVTYQYF